MQLIETVQIFPLVIGQVPNTCSLNPDPLQWILIIALVSSAGIFSVTSGIGVMAIAGTLVSLISTGASIPVIIAELSGQIGTSISSVEMVSQLVYAIGNILGCHGI